MGNMSVAAPFFCMGKTSLCTGLGRVHVEVSGVPPSTAVGMETAAAHQLAASVQPAASMALATIEEPAVNVQRAAELDSASRERQAAGLEPATALGHLRL